MADLVLVDVVLTIRLPCMLVRKGFDYGYVRMHRRSNGCQSQNLEELLQVISMLRNGVGWLGDLTAG